MLEIVTHVKSLLQSGFETIYNLMQTSFWNKIRKSDDPTVLFLPLTIFFDDFEALNARLTDAHIKLARFTCKFLVYLKKFCQN